MAKTDVAEIDFMVDGKTHRLAPPTARIAFRINRTFGGLGRLVERAKDGDLDVYVALLRAAWPPAEKMKEDALEAFVFEHTTALYLPLCQYAWSLENGGRPPPALDEAGDDSAEDDQTAENPPKPARRTRS